MTRRHEADHGINGAELDGEPRGDPSSYPTSPTTSAS
jgi:hypothetical protein